MNDDAEKPPVPLGLAVVDMITGAQLLQGILAALLYESKHKKGLHVHVSLLEAVLDFQAEALSRFLTEGKPPKRSRINNAHVYFDAPYGIYETADGYIAIGMTPIHKLAEALECEALDPNTDPKNSFTKRDEIKQILTRHLKTETSAYWLSLLEPAGIPLTEVLTWEQLLQHEGFKVLDMVQEVTRKNGTKMLTTRCPIRIDGQLFKSETGSPYVGGHNARIMEEFLFFKQTEQSNPAKENA